jgi:sporulation protein YlmC with PRC-barrel domain
MKASAISGAVMAALLALAAPVGAAFQSPGVPLKSPPAASDPAGSDRILPGQIRASKIIGAAVYDKDGEKAGAVADIVLDTRSADVAAIVIDVGMLLGSKAVAVRMSDIAWENDRLVVNYTLRELQRTVEYRLSSGGTGPARSGPER